MENQRKRSSTSVELSFEFSVFSFEKEMGSQSYKDLLVWQKSILLCTPVYQLCEKFPRSELYGLADQMKRASVSVASNIAEGQARQHLGEFLQFLSIANGSLAEWALNAVPETENCYEFIRTNTK